MLTEKDLQLAIYYYRDNIQPNPIMLPNVYLYFWESDLIYITNDDYVYEYEIKLTKGDFKADAKKETKHRILAHQGGPRLFYYVCPHGLINKDEVPEYAGLIYVSYNNLLKTKILNKKYTIKIIKQAPARSSKKISKNQKDSLLKKATIRFWREWARQVSP